MRPILCTLVLLVLCFAQDELFSSIIPSWEIPPSQLWRFRNLQKPLQFARLNCPTASIINFNLPGRPLTPLFASERVAGKRWIAAFDESQVALECSSEGVTGSVRIGVDHYLISPLENGAHVVHEFEENRKEEEENDSLEDEDEPTYPKDYVAMQGRQMAVIRILVAYSSAALREAGSEERLRSKLDAQFDLFNLALRNSGAGHVQVELAHLYLSTVRYSPRNSDQISSSWRSEYNEVRHQHEADIGILIVEEEAKGCGRARKNAKASTASGFVGYDCIDGLTFEHEVGHIIGCEHDRGTSSARSQWHGHQEPGQWRTILAYDCDGRKCPRVNHFSNPDINYLGRPTGVRGESECGKLWASDRSLEVASFLGSSGGSTGGGSGGGNGGTGGGNVYKYNCFGDQTRWTAAQRAWCCANEKRGCPVYKYNCFGDQTRWTAAQKAWCCANEKRGCPVYKYNCFGDQTRWTAAQKAWCCANEKRGCPVYKYSCFGDQTRWTAAQRAWCCANEKRGCPVYKYNCFGDQTRWTAAQRAWCCANEKRGCTGPTTPGTQQCPSNIPTLSPTLQLQTGLKATYNRHLLQVVGSCDTGRSDNPCAGVAPHSTSRYYPAGSKVVYQNKLFTLVGNTWKATAACTSLQNSSTAKSSSQLPSLLFPVFGGVLLLAAALAVVASRRLSKQKTTDPSWSKI
eukprot:NODE_391_length_2306_cov_146.795319_g362_i0.p1 GENE.NODE_391_length_2306_cov_146.795319_g362_i0~~NODE_391_length_2306_cov_146.795319_g362_i0.p1  ORF type:complete len:703 (+),score=120.59 NODE_391_length_2306_cov_146.795319_g362_i0:54-2111(+)